MQPDPPTLYELTAEIAKRLGVLEARRQSSREPATPLMRLPTQHRSPDKEKPDAVRAVAFARGVPGVMKPSPDSAEPEDAFTLLNYAAMIHEADERPFLVLASRRAA